MGYNDFINHIDFSRELADSGEHKQMPESDPYADLDPQDRALLRGLHPEEHWDRLQV